jgi:hypothetical protein
MRTNAFVHVLRTAPSAALTQFQVAIGGETILQQNIQYVIETFINQTFSMNGINREML